eukprot:scaffold236117_cov28-Tisochrysis_lutea.AAC.1
MMIEFSLPATPSYRPIPLAVQWAGETGPATRTGLNGDPDSGAPLIVTVSSSLAPGSGRVGRDRPAIHPAEPGVDRITAALHPLPVLIPGEQAKGTETAGGRRLKPFAAHAALLSTG